jgi:hypothetical protein
VLAVWEYVGSGYNPGDVSWRRVSRPRYEPAAKRCLTCVADHLPASRPGERPRVRLYRPRSVVVSE